MTAALIAFAVVALLLVAMLLSFNRFVRQRQLIDNAWSNIDTELRRRHDLVPNLVATVKGYAAHERETLDEVIRARATAAAMSDDVAVQATSENALAGALAQLLALRESYPDLEASTQFLDLQRQLTVTEDRIQAARRLYNANVRDFNTRVETLPSRVVAAVGGFVRREYFELDPAVRDASAPEVDLG